MSNYSSPELDEDIDNTLSQTSTQVNKETGTTHQSYYLGTPKEQGRDEHRVMSSSKIGSAMSSDHGGNRDEDSVSPSRSRSAYEGNGGTRHGSEESNSYSARGGGSGGGGSGGGGSGKNTADGSTLRIIQHGMGTGRGGKGTPNITGGRGKNYTNAFAGSKIKHLKKPDGVPLWRKDIQFQFLHLIFNDDKKVFTNSYDGTKNRTFADVYVDAMARSSKTSKILRDKLLSERKNALNMAMVCLLVNLGRMNTTLNFFPEMKAQLRTYHAIPSLQTYTDQNAYKQLQDAPRLKSILKGACEDRKEPVTIESLVVTPVPRTNPINLIFLLSTYAPKVTETHFPTDIDFHDLVMRAQLSSQTRATAFLWLMWWYLESDFTIEDALKNPYGEGLLVKGSDIPRGVPAFVHLTQEEADAENVDREEEIEFGERMQLERKKYINTNEVAPGSTKKSKKGNDEAPSFDTPDPLKKHKKSRHSAIEPSYSDSDRTRSVSPDGKRRSMTNVTRINDLLNDTEPVTPPIKVRGKPGPKPGGGDKSTPRIILKHKHMHIDPVTGHLVTTRSILPSHPPPASSTERAPKPRSLTAHQAAVAENRKERADHIIEQKLKRLDRKNNKKRKREGVFARTWNRIKDMEDPFANSDEEGGAGDDSVMSGIRFDTDGNLILLDTIFKDNTLPVGEAGVEDGVRLNVIEANAHLNNSSSHTERRRGNHKQLPIRAKYVNGTNFRGCAGLVPRDDEIDDFGEEAIGFAAAIRRTQRRLDRWEGAGNAKTPGSVENNHTIEPNNNDVINGANNGEGEQKDEANKDQEMAEAAVDVVDEDVEMSD